MAENQVLFKGPYGRAAGTENGTSLKQHEAPSAVSARISEIREPTQSQIARCLVDKYWATTNIEERFKIDSDLKKMKLYVDDATARIMGEVFLDFLSILKEREAAIADDRLGKR